MAVLLLALPWVEEIRIAWNFRSACQDTGVHIAREVVVDGYLDDRTRSTEISARQGLITDPNTVLDFDRRGYRYIESFFKSGKVWHLERVREGIQASILERPVAQYYFRTKADRGDGGYGVSCSEDTVVDARTNETIARYRYCKRSASMLMFSPYPIEYCPTGDNALKGMLFSRVLRPVAKR